jgi:hypothetical protein
MTSPFPLTLPTPGQRVHNGLQVLNGIAARLRALKIQHQAGISQIRDAVSHDPNMSAEGRQTALRERTAALGERSLAELVALKAEMKQAQNAIAAAIEAGWPKPLAGVEGMLGRQASWARSRSLLEGAGVTVTALIAETDDMEALFALQEELPTWVRSRGANAETVDRVLQHLDLRMGKIGTSNAQGEADLMAKFQARAIVAQLEPLLNASEAEFTGSTGYVSTLNAAVASQFARGAVEAANQPIVTPDGSIL